VYSIEYLLFLRPPIDPAADGKLTLQDVPVEEASARATSKKPKRGTIGLVTECVPADAETLKAVRGELRRIEHSTSAQIREKAGLRGYTLLVTGTAAVVEKALPMVEGALAEAAGLTPLQPRPVPPEPPPLPPAHVAASMLSRPPPGIADLMDQQPPKVQAQPMEDEEWAIPNYWGVAPPKVGDASDAGAAGLDGSWMSLRHEAGARRPAAVIGGGCHEGDGFWEDDIGQATQMGGAVGSTSTGASTDPVRASGDNWTWPASGAAVVPELPEDAAPSAPGRWRQNRPPPHPEALGLGQAQRLLDPGLPGIPGLPGPPAVPPPELPSEAMEDSPGGCLAALRAASSRLPLGPAPTAAPPAPPKSPPALPSAPAAEVPDELRSWVLPQEQLPRSAAWEGSAARQEAPVAKDAEDEFFDSWTPGEGGVEETDDSMFWDVDAIPAVRASAGQPAGPPAQAPPSPPTAPAPAPPPVPAPPPPAPPAPPAPAVAAAAEEAKAAAAAAEAILRLLQSLRRSQARSWASWARSRWKGKRRALLHPRGKRRKRIRKRRRRPRRRLNLLGKQHLQGRSRRRGRTPCSSTSLPRLSLDLQTRPRRTSQL